VTTGAGMNVFVAIGFLLVMVSAIIVLFHE
jgi:LPXTG-motif cell wall-anchored protein